MTAFLEIVKEKKSKDKEGFSKAKSILIAKTRGYKEDRHGSGRWGRRWINMAAFSDATTLFRFRKIPGVEVDTSMIIICNNSRYKILFLEDVRDRGMYYEIFAERLEPSG